MPEPYAAPPLDSIVAALLAEPPEGDAYPVSGAVAAVVTGLAASLAAAAADRSREQWDEAAGARAQAQALCRKAIALAEQDASRFAEARDALRRRGLPGHPASDYELGDAIARAAEPPLELAAGAADTARLAAEVARHGSSEVGIDAVIAARLAAAAADAAARLVAVNLVVGGDPELADRAREYAKEAARVADACSGIEL